jgi:vitamin B12 transporter
MTSPVSLRATLTSLALAIAAPDAWAQTNADPAMAAIIVTATRSKQPANEALSDTLLIGPEEVARAASLTDLLARQRGIEVARNGGPGTASSVFIRGANSNQSVVLIDGVRIGSSTTGAANWSAVPLPGIDHVEIVYGPLSTLYGADAIGGVVQIFTKQGSGAPRADASMVVGSDRTRAVDASIAGATDGEHSIRYALNTAKEKSSGFSSTTPGNASYNPDRDGYSRDSATGRLAWQLAQGHEVGLLLLQSRLDAQYDNGASGYDARNRHRLDNVALFAHNQWLPDWNSQFQVARADDESSTDNSATMGRSRINTRQTDISWQNDIRIGSDTLQLLLQHRNEEVVSSSTPVQDGARSTDSVALAYMFKRDRHLASVSVRNDDNSQYGAQMTGAAAYGYRITSALRASASVGTSFRAPSFNDLYYPGFGLASNRPEKGRNIEAGVHFDDGTSQLSAVHYRHRVTDLLVTVPVCPIDAATHPYGCAYNINQALLEGWTLSARRRFGDIHVSANLDLQHPRDDTSGKQLARRARQHANFAIEYGSGALKGGVDLQLSGRRFDDAANKHALGGHGLLNLFASYQVAPNWSLLLRVNNATDKRYVLARNYATAGAQVFAGLRYAMH